MGLISTTTPTGGNVTKSSRDCGTRWATEPSKAAPILGTEQRLVRRNMPPQSPVGLEDGILCAVVKDDRPRQPQQRLIPNAPGQNLKQDLLVDVEKEPADIQVQRKAGRRPVVRDASHALL